MRKTSDQPRFADFLQDIWPGLLQTIKVIRKKQPKKQGKTEKLSQTRGDWGDMAAKCNVVPPIGPWNREDVHRKTSEIQIKFGI